jgi:hypothetical protein
MAGVAKRPRERSPTRNPQRHDSQLLRRCASHVHACAPSPGTWAEARRRRGGCCRGPNLRALPPSQLGTLARCAMPLASRPCRSCLSRARRCRPAARLARSCRTPRATRCSRRTRSPRPRPRRPASSANGLRQASRSRWCGSLRRRREGSTLRTTRTTKVRACSFLNPRQVRVELLGAKLCTGLNGTAEPVFGAGGKSTEYVHRALLQVSLGTHRELWRLLGSGTGPGRCSAHLSWSY